MNEKERIFFLALGKRIALARKEKGLTQSQLAQQLGIAQQTLGHYEGAKLKLPSSFLADLSRILDVPVGTLLGMQEDN